MDERQRYETWQAGYVAGVEATCSGITLLMQRVQDDPSLDLAAELREAVRVMPTAAKIFASAATRMFDKLDEETT